MLTDKEKEILRIIIFKERASPTRMKEISEMSDEDVKLLINENKNSILTSLLNQKESIENQILLFSDEQQ